MVAGDITVATSSASGSEMTTSPFPAATGKGEGEGMKARERLSNGSAAGIAIGSVVAAILIIGGAILLFRRRRKTMNAYEPVPQATEMQGGSKPWHETGVVPPDHEQDQKAQDYHRRLRSPLRTTLDTEREPE